MTESNQNPPEWKEKLGAAIAARWQWLLIGVVLLFALNNLVGLVVGAVGLVAFANTIAGRLLNAARVVRQVQEIVSDPDATVDDT